jgi:EAL domain-containing protein (putative c-di-GMP-specific phosphodiesterase class I)
MCSIEEMEGWYLEGWVEGESVLRRYCLDSLPARIGRRPRLEIHLDLPHVSIEHAEIYAHDGALWIRDLHSRNGTFLNGERVTSDRCLERGDIVHFACNEFEVGRAQAADLSFDQTITLVGASVAPAAGPLSEAKALHELLRWRQVTVLFQPIVDLRDRTPAHFEILARGNHPALPSAPGKLLSIADNAGVSVKLSGLFCSEGLQAAAALPDRVGLFVNSHPKELADEHLLTVMGSLRDRYPERTITLETHETSVTDPVMMRKLRAQLRAVDIGLAYDDFGAGQARLLEIAEAPPDYLKFDISLIRRLDTAPTARRRLVASLVEMVREMGVFCVAEGIERAGELTVCSDLGFDFGQGFYLGEPKPITYWA